MSPDDPRHGTTAGYQAHRRAKESACDPCRQAQAAASAARRRNPAHLARQRLKAYAAQAARVRLVQMYPDVYAELFADEKRKRDVL